MSTPLVDAEFAVRKILRESHSPMADLLTSYDQTGEQGKGAFMVAILSRVVAAAKRKH